MFVQNIHKRIRHFVLHDLVQSPPAGPVNHEQDDRMSIVQTARTDGGESRAEKMQNASETVCQI